MTIEERSVYSIIGNQTKIDIFHFDLQRFYLQRNLLMFPKKTAYLASVVIGIGIVACTAAAMFYPTLPCLIISITTIIVLLSVVITFGIILHMWKSLPSYLEKFDELIYKKVQLERKHNKQALDHDDLKRNYQLFSLGYYPAQDQLNDQLKQNQKSIKIIKLLIETRKEDAKKPQEEIEFLLKKKGLSFEKNQNL
ncbi:hypothetical protein SBV42_00385 [Chlamydia crocodili]|uniref:Uncharacterized protein n=1 Tax=Chlamydia crocodili TaxID=2766982 RepID=A0ABX8CJ74_9CHLA|nr:hypothetical protein [Chlamydia crocodili]QVE49227.1 hypothetical protein H9Q19_00755 [Chlamydia crocodili]